MENTIILNSGQTIEVLFCDEVTLDIDCSLRYIESGKKEIASYVATNAKPQLDKVISDAKSDMAVQITQGIENAEQSAAEEAAKTIDQAIIVAKAEIEDYVATNITPELNEAVANTQTNADVAAQSAQAATTSVTEGHSAINALISDFNAESEEKKSAIDASVEAAETAAASAIEHAALFNTKAELNLENVNQDGTTLIAHQAMPSERYVDLTLGTNGTQYTAPADGFFYAFGASSQSEGWISLTNTNTGISSIAQARGGLAVLVEVQKGHIASIGFGTVGVEVSTLNAIKFIYAEGAY